MQRIRQIRKLYVMYVAKNTIEQIVGEKLGRHLTV